MSFSVPHLFGADVMSYIRHPRAPSLNAKGGYERYDMRSLVPDCVSNELLNAVMHGYPRPYISAGAVN